MGDDCHKTIAQPRFVSWNDFNTCFFNHNAKPYHLLPIEKKHYLMKGNRQYNTIHASNVNPFQWCKEQIDKSHSFICGNRHSYIMHLARYCNIKGLSEVDTLSGCSSFVQDDFTHVEIKKIVTYVFLKHVDSRGKLPFTGNRAL